MTLNIFQKIGIALGICVLLYITIDTLITKNVSQANSASIKGHFKTIERFKPENKVSVSYNLYLSERQYLYKILPEWKSCFNYDSFRNEVKEGQLITISVRNDNGLRSSELPIVVSLVANDKQYIDQNCINKEIDKAKIQIPLILLGGVILFGVVIYLNNRK